MRSRNLISRYAPVLSVLILSLGSVNAAEQSCRDARDVRAPSSIENTCPVANAGFEHTATIGDRITLDGRGSFDLDGDALQFSWTLISAPVESRGFLNPSGDFSTDLQVDAAGSYVVELSVIDSDGNVSRDRVRIDTSNSAPIAVAGPDQTVEPGKYVTLDARESGDFDDQRLGYAWQLVAPEASSARLAGANTATPTFALDVPGEYVAQVTVRDAEGRTDQDEVRISTSNSAPVAHPGWGGRVRLGSTITLDARGSTDVNNNALSYRWSVLSAPSDSERALRSAHMPKAKLHLDAEGWYLVQLIVDDGKLISDPATLVIEAAPKAPLPLSDSQRDALLQGIGGADFDGDGVVDAADNCVNVANPLQRDTDSDGIGNFCDPDFNNDGAVNFADLAIMKASFFAPGDLDTDLNGDGTTNFVDLLILKSFFFGPPGPPGTLTWINGAGGSWNLSTNWSPTSLPAEGVTAIIDLEPNVVVTVDTGTVAQVGDLLLDDTLVLNGGTLDGATITGAGMVSVVANSVIDGITLNASMDIQNGDIATVLSNLVVNGTLTISGTSLLTGLAFDDTQTLAGSGEVVFNTNFNSVYHEPHISAAAGSVLTIGPELTIRGNNGTVGSTDSVVFMNGTIHSDVSGSNLLLRGTTVAIGGTVTATNNGNVIVGGAVTATGPGMFIDSSDGDVFFGGALVGGAVTLGPATLNSSPGSSVIFPSGLPLFDNVEFNVDVLMQNGSLATVFNGLTLNNQTSISGTSLSTGFDFSGSQALDGTATISFDTNFNSVLQEPRVRPADPGTTLTIGPGITIRGNNGTIGDPAAATIMNGTVQADVASSQIYLRGSPVTLTGSLSSPAGTLRMGGVIQTPPAGVSINSIGGAMFIGGSGLGNQFVGPAVFNAVPGSSMTVVSGAHQFDAAVFNNDLVMLNGAVATVTNDLIVNGDVEIQGFSLGTGFDFQGTQTFGGNADITFATNFNSVLAEPRVRPIDGTLTLGAGIDFFGGNGTIGNPALATVILGDVTNNVASSHMFITGTDSRIAGALTTMAGSSQIRIQGSFDNASNKAFANGEFLLDTVDGKLVFDNVTLSNTDIVAVPGSDIQITAFDAELNSVSMDGVDVTLDNGAIATVQGGLTVNGNVFINGTSLVTGLDFDGGAQTFDGVATVEFQTNFNSVIAEPRVSPLNGAALTIGSGITVRGNNGLVGATTLAQGSTTILGDIIADSGSEMWVGGDFSMTGLLRAENGMNIRLVGALDNSGQSLSIDAQTGTIIMGGVGPLFSMANTIIVGSPAADIIVTAFDAVFDDVSFSSVDMTLQNGAIVTVSNGMVLNGTAHIFGTSLSTGLNFAGTQSLTGTASVIFETNFNSVVNEPQLIPTDGGTLTIGPNVSISGNNGTVGGAGGFTIMQGTVSATTGNLMELIDMRITGALNADSGALRLAGTIDNAGQSFSVNSIGGNLLLGGSVPGLTITDATINAVAGSSATVTSFDASLDNVTINNLELTIQNGGIVTVSNGLELNGSVHIQAPSLSTGFNFNGTQTFSGVADLAFEANFNGAINEPQVRATSGTLTIGPGISISGDRGTIGTVGLPLVNQGTIEATTSNSIINVTGSSVTNTGLIGTGSATPTSLTMSNLAAGSTGTLRARRGTISIDSGVTLPAGAVIEVEFAGLSEFGSVDFNGPVDFSNATLALALVNGYEPAFADSFGIIDYTALAASGEFGTVTGTDAGNGNNFVEQYNATQLVLQVL